jgi:hypothetical protein
MSVHPSVWPTHSLNWPWSSDTCPSGSVHLARVSANATVQVGGLFALLGWLTNHFTETYAHPDPFPFTG